MARPLLIRLTDEELALAMRVTLAFGGSKYKGQSDLSRLTQDPQYRIDFASACGRIAFVERFLGLELDKRASRNGDRGFHACFPDGRTLDVKTTRKRSGPLIIGGAMPGMNLRTDLVALAEVPEHFWDGRTVKLAGWITAFDFRRRCRRRDMGHGMRDVVGQSELSRDFARILAWAGGYEPDEQGQLFA